MTYRDPSHKKKRKRPMKPSYKSTWTHDKLLKELINECNANIQLNGCWTFCAESLSDQYKAKIEIVRSAIQSLRLNIPHGYRIRERNTAPHESSRNKFFWHGPDLGGWCATCYDVEKVQNTED